MRNRVPLPVWTAQREAWLERLERAPAHRSSNVVGFHCMYLGWTDWVRDAAGNYVEPFEETLTDKGRAVLAEWRARGNARRP